MFNVLQAMMDLDADGGDPLGQIRRPPGQQAQPGSSYARDNREMVNRQADAARAAGSPINDYGRIDADRAEQANLFQVHHDGMSMGDYAQDQRSKAFDRQFASPLTEALVNGGGNPVREQMAWQYANPNASLEGGVPVYRGNAGDGGAGLSSADEGYQVRGDMARQMAGYDQNQAKIGLDRAGADQARAMAANNNAEAAAVPGRLANDTTTAEAARAHAANEAAKIAMEREVLARGHGTQLAPGGPTTPSAAIPALQKAPGGQSVLDVIQGPAGHDRTKTGYLSQVVGELQAKGMLDDPTARQYAAAALRSSWGPEIDRVMGGGGEGWLGSAMSWLGKDMPGGTDTNQLRSILNGLYPDQYQFAPAARPQIQGPSQAATPFDVSPVY